MSGTTLLPARGTSGVLPGESQALGAGLRVGLAVLDSERE